ncbi:MAG: N-acetylmuramoyl-L-alanine amidase, partial [Streptococcaceae bacterium]|nr:N-acetylmuramoyl-L-alanine amidase [Streptococcaceae bacterium]
SEVATPPAPNNTKKLTVLVNGLNVRNAPRLSAGVVKKYNKGENWTLPKNEANTIADGYVWARTPHGYAAIGRNTGKPEADDFIKIS